MCDRRPSDRTETISDPAKVVPGHTGDMALCWATLSGRPFEQLVTAAARAGFAAITMRPIMYYAERRAGRSDREIRRLLSDSGVRVSVLDPLLSPLPGQVTPGDLPREIRDDAVLTEDECFRAADVVSAEMIQLAHPRGKAVPAEQLAAAIHSFSVRAQNRGIRVGLEFTPNSASVSNLAAAAELVAQSGVSNLGVILDTWHFFRSGGEVSDLEHVPAGTITNLQVCDAPAEAKGKPPVPMEDRLLPGEGAIPLQELLTAIVGRNTVGAIGVEVFSSNLQQMPADEAATTAAAALRRVLPANW